MNKERLEDEKKRQEIIGSVSRYLQNIIDTNEAFRALAIELLKDVESFCAYLKREIESNGSYEVNYQFNIGDLDKEKAQQLLTVTIEQLLSIDKFKTDLGTISYTPYREHIILNIAPIPVDTDNQTTPA